MAIKSTCKTLVKVAADEPVFVLRAQDITAPETVMHWLIVNWRTLRAARRAEALRCVQAMTEWQDKHAKCCKRPD